MRWHVAVAALLGITPMACGDGADGEPGAHSSSLGSCGLRAELRGGKILNFTGNDDAACVTQHSFDTGLDATFVALDGAGRLELGVDGIAEGETGEGYATRVAVAAGTSGERWAGSGCVTSVVEHRLVTSEASSIGELRHYQVGGEGVCAAALAPVTDGVEPVSVGPFTFRAQITWRD